MALVLLDNCLGAIFFGKNLEAKMAVPLKLESSRPVLYILVAKFLAVKLHDTERITKN